MQIDFTNQTNTRLSEELLAHLESIFKYIKRILHLKQKTCELILVNNAKIAELNAQFRGIAKATDVLSFPLNANFSPILGSIIISVDFAKAAAKNLKHSVETEIAILFIHGVLHLAGFDHESDNGEQRELESKIALRFNLPNGLIMRAN